MSPRSVLDEAARLFCVFAIAERRRSDGLREGVYRPGGCDVAEPPDDLAVGNDASQAQARDGVELGKRPHDDKVRRPSFVKEASLRDKIGERLVDDEDRRRMTAGEITEDFGGKEMAGRIVRSPKEHGLISPEHSFDLRDVRYERQLFPEGKHLHGHSGRPSPGAVIRIGGDGNDGTPFFQDPRQ
jgi:hypothetical protein